MKTKALCSLMLFFTSHLCSMADFDDGSLFEEIQAQQVGKKIPDSSNTSSLSSAMVSGDSGDKSSTDEPTETVTSRWQQLQQRMPTQINIESMEITSLDKDGYPTAEEIKRILNTTENKGLKGIYTITELSQGGSFTGKLFIAKKPKTDIIVFFIKISNDQAKTAWENLRAIQTSKIGRLGRAAISNRNLPIITNVESFIKYTTAEGNERTIEVTHAAGGKPVSYYIFDASSAQNLSGIAEMVGAALGSFHTAFMHYNEPTNPATWTTYLHGDFHFNNAFVKYTPEIKRVYFIDNETMAKSLKKQQPIDWDVAYFIFHPILSWKKIRESNEAEWYKLLSFYTHFIKGYIGVYAPEKQQLITSYLKEVIEKRFIMASNYVRKPSNKDSLLKELEVISNKNSDLFSKQEKTLFGSFSLQYRMFSSKKEQTKVLERLNRLKDYLITTLKYSYELDTLKISATVSKKGLQVAYNMQKTANADKPTMLKKIDGAFKVLKQALYPEKSIKKTKDTPA